VADLGSKFLLLLFTPICTFFLEETENIQEKIAGIFAIYKKAIFICLLIL